MSGIDDQLPEFWGDLERQPDQRLSDQVKALCSAAVHDTSSTGNTTTESDSDDQQGGNDSDGVVSVETKQNHQKQPEARVRKGPRLVGTAAVGQVEVVTQGNEQKEGDSPAVANNGDAAVQLTPLDRRLESESEPEEQETSWCCCC